MELTGRLLAELQKRLKIGNRRGVHLNAIPSNSKYKFDLSRLSYIDKSLPNKFLDALCSDTQLKFKISWKNNVPDLNSLFEDDQIQLVRISKGFENLISQTETIESEKGINTFGFGFPLIARRDNADNKLIVAPVIIWSLRIRRTKEYNTWEITRQEDDPIYINEVLINHLYNDSKVSVEQIPSEMLEQGFLNKKYVLQICANILSTVNTIIPNDLEALFNQKIETIKPIGDKNHFENLPLNSTNSLIEFSGLFSMFEVQKQNIINDNEALMDLEGLKIPLSELENHSFQSISSIETDPSQQSILHSLETLRNIIIQGPPGTGKSQTLIAILLNALENNKKTLVVCEKRTALEVLHNALIERGLKYHTVLIKDIVKDRKVVVDSVRERVGNIEYKKYRYNNSKDILDNYITTAKQLIQRINSKHLKIDEPLIGNKNWTNTVGSLLRELKENVDNRTIKIENPQFSYTSQEFNFLIDSFKKGQVLYKDYSQIKSYSFLNPEQLISDNPYLIEQKLKDDFNNYLKLFSIIQLQYEEIKIKYFENRNFELNEQIQDLTTLFLNLEIVESKYCDLIKFEKEEYLKTRVQCLENEIESIETIIDRINIILNKIPNNLEDYKYRQTVSYKIKSLFSKRKKEFLLNYEAANNLLSELLISINNSTILNSSIISTNIESLYNSLVILKDQIEPIKNSFKSIAENEYNEIPFPISILHLKKGDTFLYNLKKSFEDRKLSYELNLLVSTITNKIEIYIDEASDQINSIISSLELNKDIRFDLNLSEANVTVNSILNKFNFYINNLRSLFDAKILSEFSDIKFVNQHPIENSIPEKSLLSEKMKELYSIIKKDNWIKDHFEFSSYLVFSSEIEKIFLKKENYFDSGIECFMIEFKWIQFYYSLYDLDRKIVEELKDKENWANTFLIFYFNSKLLKDANLSLPTNDDELIELESTMNGIIKEQIIFIKEFWFSQQLDSKYQFEQNNRNISVENLYNKRASNNYKRLSLRQIIQHDANLFTDFFPIILTTPDVASNLFKGMNGYFDIVMFDEASQLRLEDNLPAVLKGKQIVIAGDEHQMPPSNYFAKVLDGSIEDEDDEEEEEIKFDVDNILLSCESLLDFGIELNFSKKYLDFHYRSRHPYLIDFSNYAFYNQRLKPLPNTYDYNPIKYIQVNGTFSEHVNEAEAEMVLTIIENNINRLPNGKYPTLGIATFNLQQRNLIKSKILERKKFEKFYDFNLKIQELEEDGMFIKNLEHIQGDERDVIILSTTYGVSKDRKFTQKFGPINHSKGYKLLNVIITRAKYKVYTCTSIPEDVFMNYREYLELEGSNNKRAVFYAYLAYSKSISERDYNLRTSILTTLAENTSKSASYDSFRGNNLESPFEEEVYQCLVDHFGSEYVIPQLQYAGFRIDLVYDSNKDGIPKIAIECDGAKFHSSHEAYLHDRYRQKILEQSGFVFHRIWSTNWWRNPNKETRKLIEFIQKISETKPKDYSEFTDLQKAFTDDVFINVPQKNESFNSKEELENLKSIDLDTSTISNKNVVKSDSNVLVKYLNLNKEIEVHLVKTENNLNDPKVFFKKIYFRSALAIALIGREVGDIIKIGNLDNYVEILEIKK